MRGDPGENISHCAAGRICGGAACRETDFVFVPGGTFTMGCPSDGGVECPPANDTHETPVTLTRAIFAQIHEVTLAEWSALMARAGTTGDFYSGDLGDDDDDECDDDNPDHLEEIAWYCANSDDRPHPVQSRTPNPWGLHDMAGNVAEWVWDRFGRYPEGPLVDPTGPESGGDRMLRGGAFDDRPAHLQHGARGRRRPDDAREDAGFRLVRTVPDR